jgi:hypothetical protein
MDKNFLNKEEYLSQFENLSQKELSIILAEPITWSWIAIEIGKGALAALGAKIFNDLFNKGADVRKLLKHLLEEIDTIITQRLEEAFIIDAIDKAEATNLALRQYINAPNQNRLDLIYGNSLYLTSRFDTFGLKTYREYIVAASIHLTALEEYYKVNPNERLNIIQFINQAKTHILSLNDRWKPFSDSRFRVRRNRIELPNNIHINHYYVVENGRRISQVFPFEKNLAEIELSKIQKLRYESDIVTEYIKPSLEIINNWEARAIQLNA